MSEPAEPLTIPPGQEGSPLSDPPPPRIGRYRVERLLGAGGFGRVYLAHDDDLRRRVAVKVPHPHRVTRPEDVEAYLAEARVLAALDHPHIVPVHDVGRSADGLCFVVSRFIEGSNLSQRLHEGRLPFTESAALVAAVAEALHHAHTRGLVHRDVKPGNILLDAAGTPYLADFGLALREEDFGKGGGFCGTPAYMSPEQANGEGHRVDGRSDIFSLGVVFYELLTGRRPFRGDMPDLLVQIVTQEPRPPRQIDDGIPRELERICLKALAKRAAERYTTARDLADDLRRFLAGETSAEPDRPPPRVVPRGLRAFDAHDADFFLELLPGPRDRDGLPDSLRFWKTRIEETDADNTFSVGLLYGPSGCGKSSLVRAGLLPRLAEHVLAVYVEATAHETEARLLNGLRKRCPALPPGLPLKESLAALRRGQGVPAGKKVLLVLDQLEQWLHAHREEESGELVQALRQCDGGWVQCLLLVRDDFWLAVSRFVRALEVDLVPGRNIALVDLFDLDHARKVLAAFGRAFGKLPAGTAGPAKEQQEFLGQAVAGLAQEGKVVCVRLAVFAEMLKGRPWTPASLKAVGGAAGVGVTFLEETFSSPAANPRHRLHQQAARAVLKALLPEAGTDIKGHMRAHADLLAASGYAARPREFDDLLRILDGELRLVTPTDPEGQQGEAAPAPLAPRGRGVGGEGEKVEGCYYQLTHDYLVPALREWLTRKQKETWRGRAELRLAERATLWGPRPERRYLPSAWEWLTIGLGTRRRDRTAVQRKMMRRATLHYGLWGFLSVAALILLVWGFGASLDYGTAKILCERLEVTETARLLPLDPSFAWCRDYADPMLRERLAQAKDERLRLHYSIALLPSDPGQVGYLRERLVRPDAPPGELLVIREALEPYGEQLRDGLWQVVDKDPDPARRFRAACALARFDDPESPHWEKVASDVAGSLVVQSADLLGQWLKLLEPVRLRLLPAMGDVFRRGQPQARTLATGALADYAADQPEVLAGLLLDADVEQWNQLWPKVPAYRERALSVLKQKLAEPMPAEDQPAPRDRLAKQQAQAAVALLCLGQSDSVWPLLRQSPDPSRRTYLLHRLAPLGADPHVLIRRLEQERDVSARRALILALGEFTESRLPREVRQPLTAELLAWYRDDPDPGIHAAIDWLLRQTKEGDVPRKLAWGQAEALRQIDAELQGRPPDGRHWYVNGQGQTMVLLPSPAEFRMGSPPWEPGRMLDEVQHLRKIPRSYALAARPVTVSEFQRFLEDRPEIKKEFYEAEEVATSLKQYSPASDGPIVFVNWYEAAAYCNWLSRQEGIPDDQWVYPKEAGAIRPGMEMEKGYLGRTGYRLPTEAEWEYACRARTATAWSYGAAEEMLPRYGWYKPNAKDRTWPVAQKKPNDFGLFDMHGNVFAWCQDHHVRPYPKVAFDQVVEDGEDVDRTVATERVMRGGGFAGDASWSRSASRDYGPPTLRGMLFGLRVARTLH